MLSRVQTTGSFIVNELQTVFCLDMEAFEGFFYFQMSFTMDAQWSQLW